MDVDEEDDAENGSTQQPKRVHDYGIEVDFEVLSGEEREVSGRRTCASCASNLILTETATGFLWRDTCRIRRVDNKT
jgi:hypothetical protein